MKKLNLLTLFLLCLFLCCEKDDVCPASTLTTPHVILIFNDASNIDNSKSVRRLSVIGEDNTVEIISESTTDSIVLPLRFQDTTTFATTRFILTKDADYDTDDDELTVSNQDIIEFSYKPEFVYVSRACGYKSIFNQLEITLEDDGDNWMLYSQILNETVENENEAHVVIYH
ncbi:MAG: hypothetical protein BM564_02605 [Bacteroidetes bacterium MedPE-SWsnd-G2]|nr:MAG: hypothetical protein BM564_02605 [Bacteroidetes bacterium MedPE-SWsnd-G2]